MERGVNRRVLEQTDRARRHVSVHRGIETNVLTHRLILCSIEVNRIHRLAHIGTASEHPLRFPAIAGCNQAVRISHLQAYRQRDRRGRS